MKTKKQQKAQKKELTMNPFSKLSSKKIYKGRIIWFDPYGLDGAEGIVREEKTKSDFFFCFYDEKKPLKGWVPQKNEKVKFKLYINLYMAQINKLWPVK